MNKPPKGRSSADYARVLEAACYLVMAQLLLRTLPFRRLTWLFARPLIGAERTDADRVRAIMGVRRAVIAAARRLPSQPVCFPRAIAAQAMLRRRGVSTTLSYGAATTTQGLQAHVWLTSGVHNVVGLEAASGYSTVLTISNFEQHSTR